ncbi:MAG: ABC transporter permease [Candidatus Cloacimonadota bacterium]|nr:ABC transporter permease [Candidatus Cloacimonadota bacterium]
MFNDSLVIFQKELKRIFTDRRLLVMIIVVPLVMLPLMYSIMAKVGKSRAKDISEYTSQIYVCEGEQTDPLAMNRFMDGLKSQNSKIISISRDDMGAIKKLIEEKQVQLLISFPNNIEKDLAIYKPFDMHIFYNTTSDYSEHALRKVKDLFDKISKEIIQERIADKGLSENILKPLTINETLTKEEVNLAKEGSKAGKILGIMLPFFLLIYLFANAMQVGLDIVAGEKERGTLAILLVNQVDRLSIVLGKLFAVMIAAFAGAASSVIGLIIASRFFLSMFGSSSAQMKGYAMDTQSIIQFAIVVIPLAILLVSIVLLVSTYAKNPKEGQGMIMPVYIAVMIMGISTMQMGDIPPEWMRVTPVFNSLIALKDIFIQDVEWGNVLLTLSTNIVLAAIIIYVIMNMFKNEKILFRI